MTVIYDRFGKPIKAKPKGPIQNPGFSDAEIVDFAQRLKQEQAAAIIMDKYVQYAISIGVEVQGDQLMVDTEEKHNLLQAKWKELTDVGVQPTE